MYSRSISDTGFFSSAFVRLSDVIKSICANECLSGFFEIDTMFPLNLNIQIYLSSSGYALMDCGTYEFLAKLCSPDKDCTADFWTNGSAFFFGFPFISPDYISSPSASRFWRYS